RVIVGKTTKAKRTPVFIGEMRSVDFSPYWNVPPEIETREIVPKLLRDSGYLERQDMEIVSGGVSKGSTIDAGALEGLRRGKLRIRQRPGPKNALGAIKFVLPNDMNVYLHGTPFQQLFDESRRNFSHGCIRVADPVGLAQFVLRDQPEWTIERMREAMAMDRPTSVALTEAIPVVIFYTTATVSNEGRVWFLPDVYGYDGKLDQLLAQSTNSSRPSS